MPLTFLIVSNYYRDFLEEFYTAHPEAAELPYERQLGELMATGFGVADAYSHGLRRAGCEAFDVISNASPLQRRWAAEHDFAIPDVRTWHHDVLEAQVRAIGPDAVLVFEYNPVGDACLWRIKPHTRLLVGQIASDLPPHRTFEAYDLMVSSWPPIVEHFQRQGGRGRYLPLAFDERMLARVAPGPKRYDVTFVGGMAECHHERTALLEHICARRRVDVWGYGIERLAADSPIRRHYHGTCWGLEMFQVLRDSRITLNVHGRIDVPENPLFKTSSLRLDSAAAPRPHANNMRLYEATGMGTCLLTDHRAGLEDLFELGNEVVSFRSPEDCTAAIESLLSNPARRDEIAQAGQARTLAQHTYTGRMRALAALLREFLEAAPCLSDKITGTGVCAGGQPIGM